jgi:hypothetical protein
MVVSTAQQQKPYKGLAMEGLIARWYARVDENPGGAYLDRLGAAPGVAGSPGD